MKKLMIFGMALMLVFSMAGCGEKAVENENTVETAEQDDWGITLSAEDVTPTGLTLIITQDGGEPTGELQYGTQYTLEVLKDGVWERVPYTIEGNIAWDDAAYLLPENDAVALNIDWQWLYGELPAGTYRLTKEFMDFRETGDFDTKEYSVVFEIK